MSGSLSLGTSSSIRGGAEGSEESINLTVVPCVLVKGFSGVLDDPAIRAGKEIINGKSPGREKSPEGWGSLSELSERKRGMLAIVFPYS